jgi:ABC-type uncharacterized transport system substrate-binding protein
MRRRDFIAGIAGSAAAWPLTAHAQQGDRVRRMGVLMGYAENDSEAQAWVAAFREELEKLGWTDGRNVSSSGFVASLSRPGGQVTGFATLEDSLAGKWLELLKEIAPRVERIVFLFDPKAATFAEYYLTPLKTAGASSGVQVIVAPVHDVSELELIIATHARESNTGLIAMPDSFLNVHRADLTSLAARYRLPAVYPYRQFAEVGGLLSYGFDRVNNFRRAAGYVDRILKGEKPADLPVQRPTRYELVINLKTAKALGLEVPWILQQRADEV